MTVRSYSTLILFCTSALIVSATAIAMPVDRNVHRTVLIVDQSGSMGNLKWLGAELIAAQENSVSEMGDYRSTVFGLVLYTASATPVMFHGEKFVRIEQITEVLDSSSPNGGQEDGYKAITKAIETYSQNGTNGLHLLLFSDEDRDIEDPSESFDRLLRLLWKTNTILDVVVNVRFQCADGKSAVAMTADKGGYVLGPKGLTRCDKVDILSRQTNEETTIPDYVELAHASGGTAWQVQGFRMEGRVRIFDQLSQEQATEKLTLAPAFGTVLRHQASERNPGILIARATASPSVLAPGDTVMFDAEDSTHMDPDEYIESWSWDFDGDGEIDAWDERVATSFDERGKHVVSLKVQDRSGNTSETRLVIWVE